MIDASLRASAARAQTAAQTMVDRPSAAEPAAHPFAEMLQQQRSPAVNGPATSSSQGASRPSAAVNSNATTGTSNSSGAGSGKNVRSIDSEGASTSASKNASKNVNPHAGAADPAGTTGTATSSRDAGQAKARNAASRASSSDDTDAAPVAAKTSGAADSNDSTDKTAVATPDASQIVLAVPTPGVAMAAQRATAAGDAAADVRAGGTSAGDAASISGVASREASSMVGVDAEAAATADSGRTASGRGPTRVDPATDGKEIAAATEATTDTTTVSSPFAATLADAKTATASTTGERTSHDVSSAAILATGHAAPHATSSSATGSAPASATVATPVDAPDFAAAFGLQVSVLAKDGLQQAQLHLNPADMGPVSIHITLDGTLAHVDFGADVAATRHAIEAGLPELASALRDAGFTLAGGGVAQHSASNGGGGASDDAQPWRPATLSAAVSDSAVGALDASARRQAQRSAAGGVDLFA